MCLMSVISSSEAGSFFALSLAMRIHVVLTSRLDYCNVLHKWLSLNITWPTTNAAGHLLVAAWSTLGLFWLGFSGLTLVVFTCHTGLWFG